MAIILGIDPGSRKTGYGIIQSDGQKLVRVDSGCICLAKGELIERLGKITTTLSEIIKQHNPEFIAIEQVFMYVNPNSALKLGQARGAAIVAASLHQLAYAEYSARQVKQAVVGYGAAAKAQVQMMVRSLLKLNTPLQEDEADALAIAVCHAHSASLPRR